MLQKRSITPSQTYFKHTVYGLRFLLKSEGLPYSFLHLPEIKKVSKLPVVLIKQEVWSLLKACTLLKHKVLIGLLYGCGLRCLEVRSVRLVDLDFDRRQVKVVQGKNKKDRYVPLSEHLIRGLIGPIRHPHWRWLTLILRASQVMIFLEFLHRTNLKADAADGKFLFPVKALSKVFRAKYVKILGEKLELEKPLRKSLFEKNWIVYAKRPFGSPKSVVEYLGRYTHKVAISNHRIQQVDEESVTFSYKDYRQNGLKKSMKLSHQEFTRRFAQHILPKRFVRIRHYGLLSSTWKRVKFKKLREHFKLNPAEVSAPQTLLRRCRCCGEGNLVTIEVFGPRGPPASYMGVCQTESNHKK